uniref:J domain-containing protein n=1 Tax=Setaria italica TaxID=4555 RepID=K3XE42_SETIT
MDPAPDPLAISASAPFPTIPAAASSPRPRAARPRRHAAASATIRRPGIDLSRRPGAAASAQQEGSPSVGSWGASRDANFVFGGGGAGAPELRRTFSSGSGEASLTELRSAVDKLVLDGGSGRRSDVDAPGGDDPVPVMNASDPSGIHGSNSSLHEGLFPDSLHDQTEKLDEGRGAPSQSIQCENAETRSLASQTSTNHNAPMELARSGDGLPIRNSVDEGSLPKDGSNISAHGGNVQQNVFVFGGHAGYRDFTANATQTSISKEDSSDKDGAIYNSEQLNASVAKDRTCTKFILQDAKDAFGSTNKNPLHSEPCEISPTVKFGSSFGSEDGSAKVSFVKVPYDIKAVEASELTECRPFDEKSFTVQDHNVASRNKGVKGMITNRRTVMPKKFSSAHQVSSFESVSRRNDHCSEKVSSETKVNLKDALLDSGINCVQGNSYSSALQITESSRDGTEFTSAANTEHSGQSDFIFSASTFNQSTLHLQRRHNKKKGGGMCNHANSTQSLPSSAIGLARSEVSATQQCGDSAAQWTEYIKMEPNRVTISGGAECTKTENFEHHEDCETWRLRGNQAYAEGQLTKAEECYTHGIDSFSPNEASRKALMLCYSNRAATRMSLGKMREALSDCREAIGIDSSFLKAQVRAANCLLALGDVEEAQKAFEMCLKSSHLSSLDHKILEEASDGLQKAQKISGFIHQSKEYLMKKAFDKIPSALQMISDALSISIYSDNLMAMKAEALLLLWRYHLIAKSYFFLGKLEEAHLFLKKYDQIKVMECRCGKQSQESISSFSMAISELLQLKAAGNEAFQSGKYLEAVEHYTAALLSNSESLRFLAVCFCNRAAAYQAMGQILDAIADCSLAIALDADYAKAISRRSSLYELIRDYEQAENDLRRLITLLEKQLQENMSMPSEKVESIRSNLNRANLRFSSLERDARKGAPLNVYMILGIEPSSSTVDIKKAYRKAALRHHPDKAGKFLVRSENISDAIWREITNEIRRDADYLFKIIGKAYSMLSDPTMRRE